MSTDECVRNNSKFQACTNNDEPLKLSNKRPRDQFAMDLFSNKKSTSGRVAKKDSPPSSSAYKLQMGDGSHSSSIYDSKYLLEKQYVLKHPVFCVTLQDDLTIRSYQKLYSYLIDISFDQQLAIPTLLSAMNILNQVLRKQKLPRSSFLIIGCAALLLASKVEEIYPPSMESMLSITLDTFSESQLFDMEKQIFRTLSWNISFPTRYLFAEHFIHELQLSSKQRYCYEYLLSLSYCHFHCNYFEESRIAAAILHYLFQITSSEKSFWTSNIITLTHYTEIELIEVILHIRQAHWFARDYPVPQLIQHYSTEEREEVALIFALSYKNLRFTEDHTAWLPAKEEACCLRNYASQSYLCCWGEVVGMPIIANTTNTNNTSNSVPSSSSVVAAAATTTRGRRSKKVINISPISTINSVYSQ